MLVLSRKVGERIVVPDCGLAVVVLAIDGNRVRLGITAPADVAVYRAEVWPGPESEVRSQGSTSAKI
jgi:carbon storage regulator